MENLQEILSQPLLRTMTLTREAINEQDRTIEFSASSEIIVDRGWWKEILDHSATSIRLGRMLNSAPMLFMHFSDQQIGVVLNCWIDEKERKLRVKVKFSRNERPEEIWQDILDGIIRNVSIGYRVHSYVLESKEEDVETYRIMDWEPLEVSIVSIPADNSVGIGRGFPSGDTLSEFFKKYGELFNNFKNGVRMPGSNNENNNPTSQPNTLQQNSQGAAPLTQEQLQAIEARRVGEIEALGKRKGVDYQWAIDNNLSIEQFRGFVIDRLGNSGALYTPSSELNLKPGDRKAYSISRAIAACITGIWTEAKREQEYSDEIKHRLGGKAARGFYVPVDVFTRDLTVGGGGATGGYLVGTNLQPQSFIELLMNKMLAKKLGARVISGLIGNVAISRKTAMGTAAWVGEGTVSKSDMQLGQIVMSPKTVAAYEQYSKQLLLQGTPAVDNLVNEDILDAIALAIDKAVFHGTGSSNQPLGIGGTSGINAISVSSAFDYAKAIEYQTKVEIANAMANSLNYVTNPTIRGTLKARPKVSNYPVYICDENNNCAGYKMEATNQINANNIFFGDFSQIIIGEWGVIDVVVDPYTLAADNLVRVIAHESVDIAVRQPGSFSVSTAFS